MALIACAWMVEASAKDEHPHALPEVELMRKLNAQWVANRMTLNGVPASMRTFKGSVPVDNVVAYYESLWRSREGAIKRRKNDWYIVATKEDGRFASLHVRPDGRGSEGIIVVSADPIDYLDASETTFPLPSTVQVLSRQSFFDAGILAETITLLSKHTVTDETLSMENALGLANWQLVSRGPASTHHDAITLEFRKGRKRARIFIARDQKWSNKTLVLVTWRKN